MPSTPYESATLLIRLYELRREETMREARNWFAREFNPNSIEDVMAALMGQNSGHFRMVTSYWDMVASFVLNGAIDEQMFNDANGEHVAVFAKIHPFLAEYRERMQLPSYLKNLETLVMRLPNASERLMATRDRLKKLAAMRAAART